MDVSSISFSEVTKTFGRRRALHRVSFDARAGEVVALLGANGAGKSTLLAIAATLLQPSSGTVRYGGREAPSAGAALRRQIGLLGHDLYLYSELSAAENLMFFGRLYGVGELGRRVDAALDRAGLSERRDDMVGGFSRGMRQRLALERTLLHEPRLVLLDEPFTGLDDAATAALQERLGELRRAGAIAIVTTHDIETIEPVLDRAVVLHAGRLIPVEPGSGSLRERYRRVSGRPVRTAGVMDNDRW